MPGLVVIEMSDWRVLFARIAPAILHFFYLSQLAIDNFRNEAR